MDLRMVWQKIHIAARIIAAIEEPSDVCVISSRLQGQRAVLKFSHFVGATAVAGRFTPGTFTNHTQVGCDLIIYQIVSADYIYKYTWYINSFNWTEVLLWAKVVGCHRSQERPPGNRRSFLCQRASHCPLRHWLSPEIRRCCHSLQHQGEDIKSDVWASTGCQLMITNQICSQRTRSVWSGGCWPGKSSVWGESSAVNSSGTSCPTCSSTGTQKR